MPDQPPKTARWVDDSAIRGIGAVKLVTERGRTVAWVRAPYPGSCGHWPYARGRGGGNAHDKQQAIRFCGTWAINRGYTITCEAPSPDAAHVANRSTNG